MNDEKENGIIREAMMNKKSVHWQSNATITKSSIHFCCCAQHFAVVVIVVVVADDVVDEKCESRGEREEFLKRQYNDLLMTTTMNGNGIPQLVQ